MAYELHPFTDETYEYYAQLLEPTGVNIEVFCTPRILTHEDISIQSFRHNERMVAKIRPDVAEYIRTQGSFVKDALLADSDELQQASLPQSPLMEADIVKRLLPTQKRTGTLSRLSIGVIAPEPSTNRIARTKRKDTEVLAGYEMPIVLRADFGHGYGKSEAAAVLYPTLVLPRTTRNPGDSPRVEFVTSSLVHMPKSSTVGNHLQVAKDAAHHRQAQSRINTFSAGRGQ
jgi:hypothetical protein